ITLAYAFTDYRAQGQTMSAVLVDIAKVPNGRLSLFNVYVALSRNVFKNEHELELLKEDDRLERLDASTKDQWGKI
ncbi:uncharacterized protein SCHCODRAFT_02480013, partial [Schizophyllum commune H4-8]|uniref:uncharacterized protein n=1 Tax=Schizophyllum commune (strain H4-8 / FGSC 9210) TaxID=578458 RepID=UPI0021603F54